MNNPLRTIIADPNPDLRGALHMLIERKSKEITIIGDAGDLDTVYAMVKAHKPNVLMIEWRMLRSPHADHLYRLVSLCPGLYIIALGARPETSVEALAFGAHDFISKIESTDRLLASLKNAGLAAMSSMASV
jgi:DNA-binding NarL/FixJ family response regulator